MANRSSASQVTCVLSLGLEAASHSVSLSALHGVLSLPFVSSEHRSDATSPETESCQG